MKTKITILITILIISFGVNIFQYRNFKKAKLDLSIADEALTVCDEDAKNQEKKLGIAYQLINEYETVFPASFMKAMYIDDSKIKEYGELLK